MPDPAEELLNVYDDTARVVDTRARREAKASGLAVGAVNVLLITRSGRVLLQRRPLGLENGGLWDKSVGGHVSAGEEFDATVLRETSEELFGSGRSPHVVLARDGAHFAELASNRDLGRDVVLRRADLKVNLRDVRHAPQGGVRNVLYHVAVYLGRTDRPLTSYVPHPGEIAELGYFEPGEVDEKLLLGELAPNMAYLWLSHAHALLALPGGEARK
jgi:8-oxo-dGTP pyrophosphatase MutT (NUDIX family)